MLYLLKTFDSCTRSANGRKIAIHCLSLRTEQRALYIFCIKTQEVRFRVIAFWGKTEGTVLRKVSFRHSLRSQNYREMLVIVFAASFALFARFVLVYLLGTVSHTELLKQNVKLLITTVIFQIITIVSK